MAKSNKPSSPQIKRPQSPAEAVAEMERPGLRWSVIGVIAVAFIIIWGLAIGLEPFVGIWGMVGAGLLTVVALGFGIYLLRLTRQSRGIMDIVAQATDNEGRAAAVEKLRAKAEKGDAMSALAQAQLVGQQNPGEAMRILESIDLAKTPGPVQDDVRANLGLMYLMHNRPRDARYLADEIRLDRQSVPKNKALYAAVVSEAFARTGKADEAKKLLQTFDAADPEFGEAGAMLYRAQVYTFMATKNRGLAEKAMRMLAAIEPNMVAAFAVKGANPKLAQLARDVLSGVGAIPKQKMRIQRR